MIPFIRSFSELMAITESRGNREYISEDNYVHSSTVDSGQRKRYIRSLKKEEVNLPDIPRTIKSKWIRNKEAITKFINDLDYNNQIQSSYELTLLESQNKKNQKDVA